MEALEHLRVGAPRWGTDPTSEHVDARTAPINRPRTVTMQLAPRNVSTHDAVHVTPPERADGGWLLIGLAIFFGVVAFVFGALIAADSQPRDPTEPLVPEPPPPTVVTLVPTTAAPPPVMMRVERDAQKEQARHEDRDDDRGDRRGARDDD